ncbi:MAG: hypothetical protein WBV82_17465 [Myxococcaceae bacterium]
MATTPLFRPDFDATATPPRTSQDRIRAIGGGVVAGLVGGIALWALSAFWSVTQQGAFWPVFKGAAAPFLGSERITSPGFDAEAVALGAVVHLLISAGWGLAFALFFYGVARALTVGAGLFWGLMVWLSMYYVLLPMVGLSQMVRTTPVWMAIVTHLFFGLVVGLAFLPFQRTYPRIHAPQRAPPVGREPVTP